jgi:hypothetical protein
MSTNRPRRNFELIKLQMKHAKIGLEQHGIKCFEVFLANRKGWQKKTDKGTVEQDLRSQSDSIESFFLNLTLHFRTDNHFLIFSQPDLPACDPFHWLPLWLDFLETHHFGRPLEPEDYVFPAMGANGVVQPREHISHDTVQKMISDAVAGAHIPSAMGGSFSTHCFRRGGAQYRFMFAPVGKCWMLQRVRWWGGWAEGEHVSAF